MSDVHAPPRCFSELLREEGISREEHKNFLDILQRNGEQLSHIINDILDLSKVEAGHLVFEYISCDPKKIALDVISLLSVKAKEKAIELKLVIDESTPIEIITDPTRLRQILLNLVGNAVKFTHKGSVTLNVFGARSDAGKEFVSFEIIDTGIGIAASQTSRIFDLFVQADGSTTRKFGGTGLGLTLSRSLARSLGGDLQVVRSEEGKGSTFQVTIENRLEMQAKSDAQTNVGCNAHLSKPINSKDLIQTIVQLT